MSTSIRLLQLAWADLIAAAPYATVGAALWVVIAYYFHQSIIDALTGRPVLPARADLVSLPAAVLLQRTRLAGAAAHCRRHRLYPCRQRLSAHRRLGAGANLRRCARAQTTASDSRSLRPAVLSGHRLAQEIGSRFETRIEGACIKHRLGKAQVKMYDKFNLVLRIETTVNDVSFFKHHRKVEHRQGPSSRELAPLKKMIYSLIDLRDILLGCCRRYMLYLSALDDHSAGVRALDRLSEDRRDEDRLIKGLNFFKRSEQALLRALQRRQFNIRGLRRADLTAFVPGLSPAASPGKSVACAGSA